MAERKRLQQVELSPENLLWCPAGVRLQALEAEWDEDNIEHIARHGVSPEEVEEVVYEDCLLPGLCVADVVGSKRLDGRYLGRPVQADTLSL